MNILEALVVAVVLTLLNFLVFGLNSQTSAIMGILSGSFLLFSIYIMAKMALRDFMEDRDKQQESQLKDEIESLKIEVEKLAKIISEKE